MSRVTVWFQLLAFVDAVEPRVLQSCLASPSLHLDTLQDAGDAVGHTTMCDMMMMMTTMCSQCRAFVASGRASCDAGLHGGRCLQSHDIRGVLR
jgi:hypothetical protein